MRSDRAAIRQQHPRPGAQAGEPLRRPGRRGLSARPGDRRRPRAGPGGRGDRGAVKHRYRCGDHTLYVVRSEAGRQRRVAPVFYAAATDARALPRAPGPSPRALPVVLTGAARGAGEPRGREAQPSAGSGARHAPSAGVRELYGRQGLTHMAREYAEPRRPYLRRGGLPRRAALVPVIDHRRRDRRANLRIGTFISGYPGSPRGATWPSPGASHPDRARHPARPRRQRGARRHRALGDPDARPVTALPVRRGRGPLVRERSRRRPERGRAQGRQLRGDQPARRRRGALRRRP